MYELIEYDPRDAKRPRQAQRVRYFANAYAAVDMIRAAYRAGDPRVRRWHLFDDTGVLLFGPDDLDAIETSDEFERSLDASL